jgi:polysaccharide export outer membrane protein
MAKVKTSGIKIHARLANCVCALAIAVGLVFGFAGCHTPQPQFSEFNLPQSEQAEIKQHAGHSEALVLREGDVVRLAFPGAPSLNANVVIRRDGMVALPLVGEFKAAGLTPTEMEKQLLKLYGPQLQLKELTVSVESSTFPVYVIGAVLRPGKILSDRPLSAFEAIVEAGGSDPSRANLKAVDVIRHEQGRVKHHKLNLKGVLEGREEEAFILKPYDIVNVPERFSLF